MNNEPKISEVLEAVNALSTHIDEQIKELKDDITELKSDMVLVKTSMVTKNYLDDKLADLRGDLVVLMRKEDKKVQSLIELLHAKKVISEEEARRILAMDLFPQVSL